MKRIIHDRKNRNLLTKNPFSDRVRSLGISLRPCYLKISTYDNNQVPNLSHLSASKSKHYNLPVVKTFTFDRITAMLFSESVDHCA